jgi:hypothetical protein
LPAAAESRTEPRRRVQRAQLLLNYIGGLSAAASAGKLNSAGTAGYRWADKALRLGIMASLDDLPRRGRPSLPIPPKLSLPGQPALILKNWAAPAGFGRIAFWPNTSAGIVRRPALRLGPVRSGPVRSGPVRPGPAGENGRRPGPAGFRRRFSGQGHFRKYGKIPAVQIRLSSEGRKTGAGALVSAGRLRPDI